MASSDTTCASAADRQYLEEKYGNSDRHLYLDKEKVQSMVEEAFEKSGPVKYMLESLKKNGCGVGKSFFTVTNCAAETGGGFSTEDGVIICYNKLKTFKDVELALTHELIHAYDFCRASNLDLTNCYHHACTEVRAANLSGDCSFAQEFLRGNITSSITGQHKKCVRRRAMMSVGMNPYCQGARAEQAVNAVFGKCFRDTDPFEKVPNH